MSAVTTPHRYGVGDRVRVRTTCVEGNPRTPSYVRSQVGTVGALHGTIPNPHDHHGVYPPLCSVYFRVRDLFGGTSEDTLSVDLHEDWLEPA